MKSRIRVLSVEDHPLIREGIVAVINGQPDMQAVAQASNGREALQCFGTHRPDTTLMDLRFPDTAGIDAAIALRTQFPDARIIILTTFDCDGEIQRALAAGARSYMLKTMPPQEMVELIRRVHAGRKFIPPEVAVHLAEDVGDEPLTDRELAVLRLVMAGNRNSDKPAIHRGGQICVIALYLIQGMQKTDSCGSEKTLHRVMCSPRRSAKLLIIELLEVKSMTTLETTFEVEDMTTLGIVWRNPTVPAHRQRHTFERLGEGAMYILREFVRDGRLGYWTTISTLEVLAGGRAA